MSTVGDLIRDSLGHLGVVDAKEAPEAQDSEDAVRALNLMLSRWAVNGLISPWQPVTTPAQTLALPIEAEEAAGFALAVRLRARYAAEPAQDIVGLAQQSIMHLWRDRLAPKDSARTVGSIILRALRMLVSSGTFPDAFDLKAAVLALNAFMQRVEADGIALGWSAAGETSEPLVTPAEADEAIAAGLALRLSPEYGVTPLPAVVRMAEDGMASLLRDDLIANPIRRRRRHGHYSFYTDSCF